MDKRNYNPLTPGHTERKNLNPPATLPYLQSGIIQSNKVNEVASNFAGYYYVQGIRCEVKSNG